MIKVFDDEDLKFDNAKYIDNPIFNVDENKLEEFDKQFPEKIKDAAAKLEPSIVTRHLVAISQAFNKFYHDNPILNSEAEVRQARLAVVFAVKTVLKEGLALLGINAPEQM